MEHYVIKKSLFKKSLVNSEDEQESFRLYDYSNFKLKYVKDGFVFYKNKQPASPVFTEVYRERLSSIAKIYTPNDTFCYVDLENDKVSIEIADYKHNIVMDKDGNFHLLDNKTYDTTPLGYKYDGSRIAGGMYADTVFVKDENGKYGAINSKTGKLMCPFIFDEPNFESGQKYFDDNNHVYSFYDDKQFILVNDRNEIILEGSKDQMPTSPTYNYSPLYTIYNEKSNTTEAYLYNKQEQTISKLGTYADKLLDIDTFGNKQVLLSINKDKKYSILDLKGKPVLNDTFDSIDEESLDFNRNTSKHIYTLEKDGKVGVFDPATNKMICPIKYQEIDFRNSGVTPSGECRLFVQDPETNLWGVVNDKGQVLVPFEYKTAYTRYHTRKRTEKGDSVWVMKIKHKDGEETYINILDENIIATDKEIQGIKEDNERSRIRSEQEKAEKEARKKAEAESKKSSPRYTEEQRFGAAVAASIVMGSPIAGLIVNEMMKD